MAESAENMMDRFDNATTDAQREQARKDLAEAGFKGIANTIGKRS